MLRAALIGCGRMGTTIDDEATGGLTDPGDPRMAYSHAMGYTVVDEVDLVAVSDVRVVDEHPLPHPGVVGHPAKSWGMPGSNPRRAHASSAVARRRPRLLVGPSKTSVRSSPSIHAPSRFPYTAVVER